MRRIIIILALAAFYLCIASVPGQTQSGSVKNTTISAFERPDLKQEMVDAINWFGIKAFKLINAADSSRHNLVFSPLSTSYALGMLLTGAAGPTRDSILFALQMQGIPADSITKYYKELTRYLLERDSNVTFHIANSLWYHKGYPVEQSFIDDTKRDFDALVRDLDFASPLAPDTINQWVKDMTNGKIPQIVDNHVDPTTRIIVLNAIHFAANWSGPFNASRTTDRWFYLTNGDSIRCPMMADDGFICGSHNDMFDAVRLSYGRGKYCMALLLPITPYVRFSRTTGLPECPPTPSYTVSDIINCLTIANWESWLSDFVRQEQEWVELALPKYSFASDFALDSVLEALGMKIAFTPDADFGRIGNGLWINDAKQKAFIRVDEKGTEAGAATRFSLGDAIGKLMFFNRPFLCVIYERETGAILFMAKVIDPTRTD